MHSQLGKIVYHKNNQTFCISNLTYLVCANFFLHCFLDYLCIDPGDLWSGSEGGVIKIWPWESIGKGFSLMMEEMPMAALLVERSFIDLRSQVTVNGVCNVLASDVKYMISDHCRGRVWTAGYQSFALWYVSLWIYNFESSAFHCCNSKFVS